ncbi:interleukin-1 receptor-associated kinase 3-like isoform X2 [Lampetra fluviatilis]
MDSRARRGSALSRSTYIYDVRPLVLDEFCRIMDTCESPMGWRDLAKHMISDMTEMRLLALKGEHGKSCTAELIWTWGQRNHTVGELLDLLEVIGNKRALNLFLREIEMTSMSPPSFGAPESLPPPPLALPDPVKVPYSPNVSPVCHAPHTGPALCQAQPSDSEPKELNVANVLDGAGLPLPGKPPGDTFCPISPGSANCSDNLQPSSSDSSGSGGSSSSNNITSDNMGGSLRNLKEDKCSNLDSEVDSSCKATMESIGSQDSPSDNNAAVLDLQQIFSLQAILEGTHNFSIDRKLGEGAFGVVYKADIHRTPFAVKLLKKQGGIQWQTVLESLHAEMKHLYMLRHPNVLELAGFCLEQDHCCLVYHFMPNGSLEDRLHRGKGDGPLLWRTRLEIAEGAARGLQYLHTAQMDPVIHGDIKSANILLDSHCQAKLGDFGIARMGPFLGMRSYTYVRSAEMRGTLAYLPDEYVRSRQLSTKVDSYSFGVVLLELLTGRKAVQEQPQPQFLKDEVEDALDSDEVGTVSERMFDRSAGPYPQSQATDVLRLACKCLDKRKKRPEMTEVLECLEAMRKTDADNTRPLALPSDAAPTPLGHRGTTPLEPAGPRQVPVESTDVHQFPMLPQDLRSHSPVTAATSDARLPPPAAVVAPLPWAPTLVVGGRGRRLGCRRRREALARTLRVGRFVQRGRRQQRGLRQRWRSGGCTLPLVAGDGERARGRRWRRRRAGREAERSGALLRGRSRVCGEDDGKRRRQRWRRRASLSPRIAAAAVVWTQRARGHRQEHGTAGTLRCGVPVAQRGGELLGAEGGRSDVSSTAATFVVVIVNLVCEREPR